MNDLASCPFCGSDVVFRHNTGHVSVSCTNDKCFLRKIWYETEQDVLDVWNLRTADDEGAYKVLKLLDKAEIEAKSTYQSLWSASIHASGLEDKNKTNFFMMFCNVLNTSRLLRQQIESLKETVF